MNKIEKNKYQEVNKCARKPRLRKGFIFESKTRFTISWKPSLEEKLKKTIN